MSIYDYKVTAKDGREVSMADYKGKVLVIVNTASKCGFTPQYNELQKLYDEYKEEGLEILAFPCNQFMKQEPGSDEEISEFCSLNFGVNFPVFKKIDVNGKDAHPLYKYLKSNSTGLLGSSIKWNFTKFLIDKNGNVVDRYAPTTSPSKLESHIKMLLNER